MAPQPSIFFKNVVAIVKQDHGNKDAVEVAAKEFGIRVISFTGDPLRCVFSFNKGAYQIIKRKKGYECQGFGVTK